MTRNLVLLTVLSASNVFAADYYVSVTGSDSNAGTANAPFATITKARDAIRTLKSKSGLPAEGVTVWLRGGDHYLSETVSFDSKDAGNSSSPIIYRSYAGEEARITGSKKLSSSAFKLVDASSSVWSRLDAAARGKVYVADLKAQGFTNLGTLRNRGFNMTNVAQMEMIVDDEPMTLARWPNAGEPMVKSVTAPNYKQITYSGNRPSRWSSLNDVWVHGCLANTWTDFHMKVTSIDQNSKTITFSSGPGSFATTSDQPYYYYNLIEELDRAGEYYIDRSTSQLYYWPKTGNIASENVQLTLNEKPLLQFSGASHIILRDLTFQNTRGGLINVASGNTIKIEECLVRNAGTYGVILSGSNHLLTSSDVTNTGEDGIIISGGDRASLTPGNIAVTNSRIHRTSRISWTYHPAITINKGSGNRVSNNLIDDLPHSGIVFSGNNHVMELNEIREVCKLTSDTAAIYSGTDWGYRGNVIKNNLIHDVHSSQEGYGAHGIYLDDCLAGVEVTGNIIYNVSHVGIVLGGGRDNIIKGNIIANCSIAHSNDDRGRTRIVNTAGANMNMLERLFKDGVNYQSSTWAKAYPELARVPNSFATLLTGTWRNPENCVFDSNVGWNNSRWTYESNTSGTGVFSVYASMANNAANSSPLFDAISVKERAERPASVTANVAGFKAIPFHSIGRMTTGTPAVPKAPVAPAINSAAVTGQEIKLEWSNRSNLPSNQVTSFRIERKNLPDGSWTTVENVGKEVGTFIVKGLAPETSYQIRVIAINAEGSAASNPTTVVTGQAPYVEGKTVRYEVEDKFTVLKDVTSLRKGIDSYDAVYDSNKSLRIYDVGDSIRIAISVPKTGLYRILYRGTSGGAINNTSFWPNGYKLAVDGEAVEMHGDSKSLSPADNSYGNVYWGSMKTEAISLTAGSHNVDITSNASWGVADYIEITPIQPPSLTSYANWAAANFASNQSSDKLASASGDGVTNLMKYALDLPAWTKISNLPITSSLVGGRVSISFDRPADLTDVSYTAEVSNDESNWTQVPLTVASTSGSKEKMKATDNTGSSKTYIRLRVTLGSTSVVSRSYTAEGASVGNGSSGQVGGDIIQDDADQAAKEAAEKAAKEAAEKAAAEAAAKAAAEKAAKEAAEKAAAEKAAKEAAAKAAAEKAAQEAAAKAAAEKAAAEKAAKDKAEKAAKAALEAGKLTQNSLVAENVLKTMTVMSNNPNGKKTSLSLKVIGNGTSKILARNVGPTLANFGTSGFAADPSLEINLLTSVRNLVAKNDNWSSSSTLNSATTAVGAFALKAGSKDASIIAEVGNGQNEVTGIGSGRSLLEVYGISAKTSAISSVTATASTSSADSMVVGFVIDADHNVTVELSASTSAGSQNLKAKLSKGSTTAKEWSSFGNNGNTSVGEIMLLTPGAYTLTISNTSSSAREVKAVVKLVTK